MSRKNSKNRREVIKFYSPEGYELKFGDKLIIKKRIMTPYGMDNILFTVVITKDNVKDLIKKEWEPSEAVQAMISKVTDVAVDAHEYYYPFVFLLKLIKNEMYGTDSNEGCEYGLNLTGATGKFTAPVAHGYPLFKSSEDVDKAITLIDILYKLAFEG